MARDDKKSERKRLLGRLRLPTHVLVSYCGIIRLGQFDALGEHQHSAKLFLHNRQPKLPKPNFSRGQQFLVGNCCEPHTSSTMLSIRDGSKADRRVSCVASIVRLFSRRWCTRLPATFDVHMNRRSHLFHSRTDTREPLPLP